MSSNKKFHLLAEGTGFEVFFADFACDFLEGCNVGHNVNLRKLLIVLKSQVRETNLFTGAISNQVRSSQASRFVSFRFCAISGVTG